MTRARRRPACTSSSRAFAAAAALAPVLHRPPTRDCHGHHDVTASADPAKETVAMSTYDGAIAARIAGRSGDANARRGHAACRRKRLSNRTVQLPSAGLKVGVFGALRASPGPVDGC